MQGLTPQSASKRAYGPLFEPPINGLPGVRFLQGGFREATRNLAAVWVEYVLVYDWYTIGIRLVYGWYTAGFWRYTVVYGWFFGGIRWYTAGFWWYTVVYGWYVGGIRVVYGWYTGGIRVVYGWYTIGIRMVYGWYMGGIRMVCGWYTIVISTVYDLYTIGLGRGQKSTSVQNYFWTKIWDTLGIYLCE